MNLIKVATDAIPPGALAAFVNMVLILITIWIGNASDYLRDRLTKNKDMRCWGLLQLLTDVPDATIGVLVGMAAGLALSQGWGLRVRFSDSFFFYAVLPPVIFYQGYSLKKRRFFKYFHIIVTLGVLGTILHFAVLVLAFVLLNRLWLLIGLPVNSNLENRGLLRDEVLLLCSVLSSSDEVAALALIRQEAYPKLSAVLFGEGVLNDAVSILLFRSILAGAVTARSGPRAALDLLGVGLYLLVCSSLVGLAVSLAISRFLKVNTGLLQHPTRQTIIIVLGSYLSYAASELLEVPGVLSVFVCGIVFSHFAWHSLAPEAQVGTAIFSHALSSAAETYSFTALGLSVYRFRAKDWSLRYTCIALVGLLLARAAVVFGTFGVTGLAAPRHFAMPRKDQLVLFGAGLIRGAITWAQALQMQGQNRRVMISTTLVVISATLVVVGGLLPSALRALGLVANELQDAGEMEGLQEALSFRRHESAVSRSHSHSVGGEEEEGPSALSFSSPYEIAECGGGGLSRQPSAAHRGPGVGGGGGERTPLLGGASSPLPPAMPPPPPFSTATSLASVPEEDMDMPRRVPSLGGVSGVDARRGEWAANGGQLSWQGPVLYGPVHWAWIQLDERLLKPVFGGRSRASTPWGSYVGGRAVGLTPHASYSSDKGGGSRSYGAVAGSGGGGGGGGNGNGNDNGNENGQGEASALDAKALQKAFEARGFHIRSSSISKAAEEFGGMVRNTSGGSSKGGGGGGGKG